MIRMIRVELLKLRTMRVTYGLLLAGAVVTGLFATLQASKGERRVGPVSTAAGLGTVTTASGVTMVLAAVLGVIAISGEFRHASATLTFLAAPHRARVLAAKAIAAAVPGFGYGMVGGVVATAVGLGFVAGRGDSVTLGTATMIGHVLGAGLGAALLAALGVACGALLRSQLAGVIGVFVWCLVVESVVGANVSSIRPYLPYTAASTLGGAKLGAAAFGPGYSISGQSPLPFLAAAALVVAIGAVCASVAARTSLRADVT
jgi:ABC-type transport system involved in multi-copper enzyme maturation permease subunit